MSSTTEEPYSVLNEGLTHPPRQRVLGRQDIVSFIFLTMVGATVTYFANSRILLRRVQRSMATHQGLAFRR